MIDYYWTSFTILYYFIFFYWYCVPNFYESCKLSINLINLLVKIQHSRQPNQSEIAELCFNSQSNSPLFNLTSHLLIERSLSAQTSIWVFYVGVCQFLPACLSGAFLGAIGDLYSRKRVLLVALIGNALGALACAAVVHWFFNYYFYSCRYVFL